MATISGDNLLTALNSLIINIVPVTAPTKRFVNGGLGRDGRPQRHEDRIFAIDYQGEIESVLCFGARQMQLMLNVTYSGNVIISDTNEIKQTLLEWVYPGLILADSGPSNEMYGSEGETALVVLIPIYLDYKPLEME
jgi:hypothetical protein